MRDHPPPDPADRAQDFSDRFEEEMDYLVARRMQELGIPEHLLGAPDFDGDGR